MLRKYLGICCLVAVMMANVRLCANDDDAGLTIGSKAPALDIEHWLSDGEGRFARVKQFESGKVYVVEFWATWCGPCIASMPHISKIQDEFADKGVTVVSVSDEDLETVQEFLKRKTPKDENMTFGELTKNYCLTTDPDESVYEDYMRAAGQNGIPTAFIVGKQGLIEWIGHPMEMDEPLKQVVEDAWDRSAFAEEFKESQQVSIILSKVSRAMRDGDTDAAIEMLDKFIGEAKADGVKKQLMEIRTRLLLRTGDERAIEPFKEMMGMYKNDSQMLNQLAWFVVEQAEQKDDMNQELLKVALEAAELAVKADPTSGAILDTLAHLQELTGDLEAAIATQTKAVDNAEEGMKGELESYLKKLKDKKTK